MRSQRVRRDWVTFTSQLQSAHSCPTLCDPMDCSPPDSSVHGISHWSRLPFPPPGGLPDPGIEPASSVLQVGSYCWATRDAPYNRLPTVLPINSLESVFKNEGYETLDVVISEALKKLQTIQLEKAQATAAKSQLNWDMQNFICWTKQNKALERTVLGWI